ncbi:hypothetical protein X975_01804, partial [Stegodyphus mimosarum]
MPDCFEDPRLKIQYSRRISKSDFPSTFVGYCFPS